MPTYFTTVYYAGHYCVTVEADDPEDAEEKAMQQLPRDTLEWLDSITDVDVDEVNA